MKFQDKEIKNLTDDELFDAIHSVGGMDGFRIDKLNNPRKRHAKIFNTNPPVENPLFTKLVNELNKEFKSRKSKNAWS